MLYSKLRICKIYQEELESLQKLKRKAHSGDALTEAGIRQRQTVPQIETEIQAVTAAYKECINAVLADVKFQAMDPELQKACRLFYFKNLKAEQAEESTHQTNLIRSVRNYCHKL